MEQKKTELSSIAKRMKRIIHFKDYSDRDLLSIVRAGTIKRYPVGSIIYHEGGESYGLGVLFKGEVHLYKLGPRGQENIISVVKPVIMFNEISAIDGGENPETAVAYKSCIIWSASHEVFKAGLDRFPELGLGLLSVLARRNRRLISKYADLSFRPVSERLAMLLLNLSEHGERKIIRKENSIQQMAALVATDPVVISRKLGEFKEAGIIECSRVTIIVHSPEKLADLAQLDMETVLT